MKKRITVIGAGPGGYVSAIRAAQQGAEVTLIEQESPGGTCLHWGCIPSKVMKTTAELLEKLRSGQDFGIRMGSGFRPDMEALMDRKRKVVKDQTDGIFKLIKHHKIHYLKGVGRIGGPGLSQVELPGGDSLEVRWDRLILAPGSRPSLISSLPFDGKKILSSNDALSLREIPESLLIVGGGVIGCEFAFIFASLGSEVTLVEALGRVAPLPSVDEDCSKVLRREMKKRKITLILNATVDLAEESGDKILARIVPSSLTLASERNHSNRSRIQVDKALICIGRSPNSDGLGLEDAGVRTDEKGWILVNEQMETSVAGIYAIGDILGPSKVMLAHVASKEGWVAAKNAMGDHVTMNYDAVPTAIFTMPEVANVGLTEAQAKERGYPVRSDTVLFRNLGKPQVMGEIAGQTKIVSDAESGKILGIHMIGPRVTDLIAEGTLALRLGCTVRDLAETIHAHPTLSEAIMEASFRTMDLPLHG